MITDETTRNDAKDMARVLHAISDRMKELSAKVVLNESSADGDEIYNIAARIESETAAFCSVAGITEKLST